jgi:ABC-2 type transport system permease protein
MAFGFPIMMGLVFGVIFLSNKSTSDAADQLGKQTFSVAVTDESKLVNLELLKTTKALSVSSKQQGINDVKSGKLDGYIYYPANFTLNGLAQ